MSEITRIEKQDNVAVIVINSPPVNTITAEMRASLAKSIEQLKGDASV